MAQNTPGQQLFDLLVTRGFDPEILDSRGQPAPTAEDAEIFSFEFVSDAGKNYGTVVAMLGDDKQLELFSGDNVGRGMDSEDKTEWYDFQHQLKNFATRNFMTYGSQNINRLKYSMQGQAALKEGLFESWNGTKNVSWNGSPDSVRLMIRHKRPMGVNEARFRQVESLFVETADGERFKLPFRNLSGGRAMVEHVRHGGLPYDMRGAHIANMVEELNVLSRFRRASHGRVFEGDTANLVTETNQYYSVMSRTLKGLSSARGYNTYFESWNPADITEQDLIIEDIKTLFVQETIDSRIEQALPILARIQQQGTAMKEANIFEAWADQLVEGTWELPDTPGQQQELVALLSQELPVGTDATNATEQLYNLFGDDVLFDRLQEFAEIDADADCRDIVIARMQEMTNGDAESPLGQVLAALEPAAPGSDEDYYALPSPNGDRDEINEGQMGEVDLLMKELASGIADIYDVMNHPKTPVEKYAAGILQDMYDSVAIDSGLHGDDNFEEIMDIMADRIADDYGTMDDIKEASVDRLRELSGMARHSVDGGMNNELLQDDQGTDDRLPQDTLELIDEYIAKVETDADRAELIQSVVDGYIHTSELEYALSEEVAVTTGNPPLEETVSLQGQYGHSGKLQKFDDVEEDVLHRLRQLSGMIRSS